MPLHPHLHLLIPSSNTQINLEARLYLPRSSRLPNAVQDALPLVTSIQSTPIHHAEISDDNKAQLRDMRIKTLITAAHPWQKLGGNMLDPILCRSLTNAIYDPTQAYSADTALITFNARGVALSGGSVGVFGLSTITNEKDFSAMEEFGISLLHPQCIKHVGYSWGSVAALNASPISVVKSTLLISPPSTLFSMTTLFSSRTFSTAIKNLNSDVTVIHGTKDQFTSLSAFQSLAQYPRVRLLAVEGADHFYRDRQSAHMLESNISQWLQT